MGILDEVRPDGGLAQMLTDQAHVVAVDCGKFSRENGAPECENRAQTGMGVIFVVVIVVLVIGFVVWRFYSRNLLRKGSDT